METTVSNVSNLLKNAAHSKMPAAIAPMKATLVNTPFNAPGWCFETKWDGYRALAIVQNGEVRLISRNRNSFDRFYPVIRQLENWNASAIIDGEIVVVNSKGISNFGALQNWRSPADGQLVYYVFDIIWYEGRNLINLPLTERQAILKAVLPYGNGVIRLSSVQESDGISFFRSAEKHGLEGIIAKKAGSKYLPGVRSREWLKIKVQRRQEVVIGGFTQKADSPKMFSALLAGVYQDGRLRYLGKVGTGFPAKLQKEMMAQFHPLIIDKCPFDPAFNELSDFLPVRLGGIPTWLRPELVGEVNFAEVTADGRLRQASFKGMRADKQPKEVTLEIPVKTTEIIRSI